MNKGYVILADTAEQQRQAAACAYSIRIHNADANITLVITKLNKIDSQYSDAFDSVVELPFNAQTRNHVRSHDWQLYWASPYEYTIALDCRTLVQANLDSVWEYLTDHHDVCFPSQVSDFRLEPVRTHYLSEVLQEYNMQEIYTSVFYFCKNQKSLDYFKFLDVCSQNWQELVESALGRNSQEFDINLVHTFCVNRLGLAREFTAVHASILEYVDMDIRNLELFRGKVDRWTSYLTVWPGTNAKVKIQNFVMGNIFNYMESEFLTEEIFNAQRKYATST
jgi:hypothetical protein